MALGLVGSNVCSKLFSYTYTFRGWSMRLVADAKTTIPPSTMCVSMSLATALPLSLSSRKFSGSRFGLFDIRAGAGAGSAAAVPASAAAGSGAGSSGGGGSRGGDSGGVGEGSGAAVIAAALSEALAVMADASCSAIPGARVIVGVASRQV